VEEIVAENLSRWQEEGLVPDMAIEFSSLIRPTPTQ
jgi:hypothetical protein